MQNLDERDLVLIVHRYSRRAKEFILPDEAGLISDWLDVQGFPTGEALELPDLRSIVMNTERNFGWMLEPDARELAENAVLDEFEMTFCVYLGPA